MLQNLLQGWDQHFLMDGQGPLGLFGRRWVEVSQIVAFYWTASFSKFSNACCAMKRIDELHQ